MKLQSENISQLIYLWLTMHAFRCNTYNMAKLLLPAATKLDQGNVFTGVCDSVNTGGVCLSACWDTPPLQSRHPRWEQTPPEWTPPQSRHSPGSRGPPPPGADTALGAEAPPGADTPPRMQTPTYGLRVAGTHPTGMHSCFHMLLPLQGNNFSFLTVSWHVHYFDWSILLDSFFFNPY